MSRAYEVKWVASERFSLRKPGLNVRNRLESATALGYRPSFAQKTQLLRLLEGVALSS